MGQSILYYTGAAFLGGVILNIMPCVLPVLTMKVFHIIEKAKEDPSVNRRHGLAYAAGILASFWVLAIVIIALRAGGDRLGWGMQFQSPAFVAILTGLMVAFGLNALGVFEITVGMSGVEQGEGYGGTFINGIVAAVMSTPCSAPFLGAAATFALGSGAAWWQTMVMFTFIGLGLAFPFLLVSYIPAIGRKLPKPGPWMETFKHLMGFTLLAAAVWLFGTLQSQITKDGQQWFLAFLLVMAMGLWAIGRFAGLEHSDMRRRVVQLLSVGAVAGFGYWVLDFSPLEKETTVAVAPEEAVADEVPVVLDGKINWAAFSPDTLKAALDRGRPVFVDFTADWCASCKTNEKVFIEVDTIRNDLQATKILPMKADFTNEDEVIEAWISKLGREAVPIYVVFYPDGTHDLLPEVITTDMLSKALHKASSKYPPDKFKAPSGDTKAARNDVPAEKHAAN